MSIRVCNPLKRAKSTVGVPLSNATPVPLQSVDVYALIAESCTLNEVTAAIGASVPTTKEDPVGEVELVLMEPDDVEPLPHPAMRNEPTASVTIEGRKSLPRILMSIFRYIAFCGHRGPHGASLELTHGSHTNNIRQERSTPKKDSRSRYNAGSGFR
jgi:hypothetical protein